MTTKLMVLAAIAIGAVLVLALTLYARPETGGASATTDAKAAAPRAPVGHSNEVPKGFKEAGTAMEAGAVLRTATFGAGCFWGVEATFRSTPGVLFTAVGYAGGKTDNPTYREVCSDETGHAEVVQLVYDANKSSYDALLDVFWANHDPTTLNRQGPDFGSQYRSVVFYHDDEQKAAAAASRDRLQASGRLGSRKVVTRIEPAPAFYIAEEYHQQYLEKRGLSSCHVK